MSSIRLVELASALSFAVVASTAGCAHTSAPGGSSLRDALTSSLPGAPRPAPPVRRAPPPRITTPMQGEPSAAALAESRLVSSGCVDLQQAAHQMADDRVQHMRAEVDEQLRNWVAAQPGCWAEYRSRAGLDLGADGAGLSGIGEGGGGFGVGIGLGSIGTIGHGAGIGGPPSARSASRTNNQVEGVDEADIVKTDGRWVYLAMNGALRILEALHPRVLSVTRVPGQVREMLVEGDRAVVFAASGAGTPRCTSGYDCASAGDDTSTRILVYDIADRAAPRLAREISLSGSLVAARRIGNAIHTVVAHDDSSTPPYSTWPDDLDFCGTSEAVVRARIAALKFEAERRIRASTRFPSIVDKGVAKPACATLLRTAFDDGGAFTTVVSFDLSADKAPATTAALRSYPGAIFASGDALYLSVLHRKATSGGHWYSFHPTANEVTEIHKFRVSARPQETHYVGSGVVPGHVLNQFAMDEWYGYLRVATTQGRVPDPNVASAVSILAEAEQGNLVRVGAVQNLAPGEDIRAVRFDDDRGYVVTFKKTDPLFVIDLYNPAHPAILGQLKIPGFSTYMHRIDADHLLSIGLEANGRGDLASFDSVILRLFDVKDPTAPRLIHKEKIGTPGSSSAAATNHLAFNFLQDRGLLAIPIAGCEGRGDGGDGQDLAFSRLFVYDVDVERGFTRLGGIEHGRKGATCDSWRSEAGSIVQRSVFLDALVYSIATDQLKVQRLGHFGVDLASIALSP
jgi:hypothetical protein